MSLAIKVQEKEKGVFLIAPKGEINTETYGEFEKQAGAVIERAAALVFDLKDMSYISSMGLGAFFRIKQAIEKKNGTIMLVNTQPHIQTVFETMKILPDHMFASLDEADEYLDSFLDGIQKGKINPRPPRS